MDALGQEWSQEVSQTASFAGDHAGHQVSLFGFTAADGSAAFGADVHSPEVKIVTVIAARCALHPRHTAW